ncbi:Aspercryptin biosynthesis cluster-specific transcription regulator atnN [Fusarium oxysporum f. sp. albedinis]|nr:Aspercryptin biosynthesis cluster-specific transcription regulator atnN [Fusarium oxysporum f. sp. albedinis]
MFPVIYNYNRLELCNSLWEFMNQRGLFTSHLHRLHDRQLKKSLPRNGQEGRMEYCEPCNRSFVTPHALEQHLESKHPNTYCFRCQKHFSHSSAKQQHIADSSYHHVCYKFNPRWMYILPSLLVVEAIHVVAIIDGRIQTLVDERVINSTTNVANAIFYTRRNGSAHTGLDCSKSGSQPTINNILASVVVYQSGLGLARPIVAMANESSGNDLAILHRIFEHTRSCWRLIMLVNFVKRTGFGSPFCFVHGMEVVLSFLLSYAVVRLETKRRGLWCQPPPSGLQRVCISAYVLVH